MAPPLAEAALVLVTRVATRSSSWADPPRPAVLALDVPASIAAALRETESRASAALRAATASRASAACFAASADAWGGRQVRESALVVACE